MSSSSETRIEGGRALTARGDKRREAVLRAATEVFFEKGFEKATLSDIVARAGGSKSFIYDQFGDKTGLFRAMMADSCEAILRPLTDDLPVSGDPREAVTRFAHRFLEVISGPQALALQRVAIAEGHRNPEVAEAYFASGHDVAYGRLVDYLASVSRVAMTHTERARLVVVFLAMIRGQLVERLAVGSRAVPPHAETDAVITLAVDWLTDRFALRPHP